MNWNDLHEYIEKMPSQRRFDEVTILDHQDEFFGISDIKKSEQLPLYLQGVIDDDNHVLIPNGVKLEYGKSDLV